MRWHIMTFSFINLFTDTLHTFKPKNDTKICLFRIRSSFYSNKYSNKIDIRTIV